MSFVAVAIGGSAVIGAGASIAGGIMGSNAAKDAANTQAGASMYATDVQKQIYDQQRSDQQPWRDAGGQALNKLNDPSFQKTFGMDEFQKDPGYDFRMAEGQKALERSAAARGGLQSGGTLKAVSRYGQDYASGEYQNAYNRFTNDQTNRFNRLASVAGVGQTANAQLGQAGQNYANQVGQNAMGIANAQGAAGIAGANAWGNSLSGIGSGITGAGKNWMDYSLAKQFLGGGGGGGYGEDPGLISSSGGWGGWE
jgi:hypothetical protein